ncbi:glycerate kinase [Ramlibacter humi]|uniref:Glycerate kinase n=1 Tax=Ramlibacter humi TaxID=2530451 RepID=A0A4Z0BUW3_9BURK|nr:glycerate kinase [Ramlibacter humi]TFZ01815.1 glycerate kinase [Ramlibacter humi]
MNFQRIFVPILGVALVAWAWSAYGWGGVALVLAGMVMWVLLNFTRMTGVLKRAADQPVGYVGSAVMLNAKLKPGLTLLHVIGLARALGEQLSPKDEQPEIYRWTDGTASSVSCEFVNGKLAKWTLVRPRSEAPAPETPAQ